MKFLSYRSTTLTVCPSILLFFSSMPLLAVTCNNNSGDAALLQNAINATPSGGTVPINGSCNLSSTTLTISNPITLNGGGTLNYTSTSSIWALQYAGNNLTVSGLTFNGGGIHGTATHSQGGWQITNNTFQNVTANVGLYYGAIHIDHILTTGNNGATNTISNNTFSNIWQGGYPNLPGGSTCGNECIGNSGIWIAGGVDNTTFDSNTFDEIAYDGLKWFWNDMEGLAAGWHFVAHNVVVSNNTFTRVHRIGVEFQAAAGNCPGGCQYVPVVDGLVVKGNFFHAPAFTNNPFAFSLMSGGTNTTYMNNTAAVENLTPCYFRPAIGVENSVNGGTIKGNVISSVSTCNSAGWAAFIASGYSIAGYTNYYQENMTCGLTATSQTIANNQEPYNSASDVELYEYKSETCPNASNLSASSLGLAFSSPNNQSFPSGGSGTWNLYAVSQLSVRNVQFFVDGSTTPVAAQELQDVNTNFASDRKWLYHVTINTSSLGGGTHTITARATDVSGATQSVSQNFVVGYNGTLSVQVNPAALSFGSQTLGLGTASQTVTLGNSGTALLTIGNIGIGGMDSADFQETSTCGSTLAAGASCAIAVTFTPSVTGSRSATLSISDNASGSPQAVSLSGTGVSASGTTCSSCENGSANLPKNLPAGMILWLANDAGVMTNGTGVSTWEDQSGKGNDAVQTQAAHQPTLVNGDNGEKALHFDGKSSFLSIASMPIDGLTGMTVFAVSANSSNVAAGYAVSALLSWPETNPWGWTFFGTYQTSSHFRFGTTQVGNELTYSFSFPRTQSFGLSEWMHNGGTDSMWFNGQTAATFTGRQTYLAGVGNTMFLGEGGNNTFFPGDVSEIIIYSRALSTAERQMVEQYLMTKYHL